MIDGKTYYQMLGLLVTAEDLVIRAAYRSLSNKYHPDKWTGDKEIAHVRMSEINAAYETLGDSKRRQRYDDELRKLGKYDDAADIDNNNSDFEGLYSEHSDAWDVALQFFPNLNGLYEQLRTINSSLAYTFKTILIERKIFAKGSQLAEELEHVFLVKYFGNDESILALAKFLITNKARSTARELNQIVTVMGASVTSAQVEEVLRKRHSQLIDRYHILSRLLPTLLDLARRNQLDPDNAIRLLKIAGVSEVDIESHWWYADKYTFMWIDGTKQRLHDIYELRFFITDHVLSLFGKHA